MGQTLPHGIYLPDEGERNCYNGLAANWQLLDGAVGTVAEHTSALAGKAPLVHTHSKADITDLFNSANTWTSWQTLENTNANSLLRLRRADIKIGNAIPSVQKEIGSIGFAGSDNINLGLIATRDESNGHTRLIFAARQRYDSNGNRANNGNSYEARINLGIDESHKYYLSPNTNGDIDLGTSTNKWKTLNGVNPGALSLPKGGTTENVDYFNVATVIKPTGGTGTNFSGTINYYQPTIDGWLSLVVTNCTDLSVWETTVKYGTITSGSARNRQVMIPVLANHTYEITIQGTAWLSARLIPCQGNT